MEQPWITATWVELDGHEIRLGDEVTVEGKRGSFYFRQHVTTADSQWVDVYGGTSRREKRRSFPMDRVHPTRRKGRQ